MLPEGFQWRTYLGGPALYLGDRQLADVTALPNGKFRACMHPVSLAVRYEFFDSERAACLYIEAWAGQWEARLRGH